MGRTQIENVSEQGAQENIRTQEEGNNSRLEENAKDKHHNCCSSPHSIRMIISRRMRWVGHSACMGKVRNIYKILDERSLKGRHYLDHLQIDGTPYDLYLSR
jgi:hypothetical protein